MLSANQVSGDDVELSFQGAQLVVGGDHLGPDLAVEGGKRVAGSALQQQLARGDDGHAGAELAHVIDDVGGEDDGAVAAQGGEQVQEAIALGGVQAGRGLVDNDEAGIAEQRLRDAEALLHAAGIGGEGLLANVPQIGLLEQRVDHLLALGLRRSCPS